ncbi:hypothetical protein Hanom_Chr14g01300341 [Helianthus anomalus]
MVTSPHSNPEVASSSLARSQCPYGNGFTPRLRLAGWRPARWDRLDGWEDRRISPPTNCFTHIMRTSRSLKIYYFDKSPQHELMFVTSNIFTSW